MSRIILPGQTPAAVSQRKVREAVSKQQDALVTLTMAMHLFLRLNFWGRVRWFLFGARAFGPPPQQPAAGEEA